MMASITSSTVPLNLTPMDMVNVVFKDTIDGWSEEQSGNDTNVYKILKRGNYELEKYVIIYNAFLEQIKISNHVKTGIIGPYDKMGAILAFKKESPEWIIFSDIKANIKDRQQELMELASTVLISKT